MDIEAIILDFGNVILPIRAQDSFDALELLINPDHCPDIPKYVQSLCGKHECGAISDVLFINGKLKKAYPKVQAIDVMKAWNKMLLPIPEDNIRCIVALKKKYPLYLLSNTNGIHINHVMRHLDRDHDIKNWRHYLPNQKRI